MRQDLRLDPPREPDDLLFTGFPLDYDMAMLSFRAYHDHGVLPFAGGALDQPLWWWDMVTLIDRMYYARWWMNKDEAEAAREKGNGGPHR